jgi:alpha-tubulin suppressor-like RCC1 family protein
VLNGLAIGGLPPEAAPGQGWTTWYQLLLPTEYLSAGDNILFIGNRDSAANEWGVKLNALRPMDAELGYFGDPLATTAEGAAYLVPMYGGYRELSVNFYDISASEVEVEISVNGSPVGYASSTADGAWGSVEYLYAGPKRLTRVDFKNVNNPLTEWGVKVAGEEFVPFTSMSNMAAGAGHSVVVKPDGTVWASGDNIYGQLGDGTTSERWTPVQVIDTSDPTGYLTDVDGVSVEAINSAALKPDGTVWTWGYNGWGQLGDGTTANRSAPVKVKVSTDPVEHLTGVVSIAAGYHMAALKSDGTVWTWGRNTYGQLGDDTTDNSSTPVKAGISNVVDIAVGSHHTVALKSDGTVWAWGLNTEGELGDGTTTDRNKPVQVLDPQDPTGYLTDVKAIYAGNYHTLALKSNGELRAWGWNGYGQLGDGTTDNGWAPVRVIVSSDPLEYLTGVVSVSAGRYYTVALLSDGTVWAWGWNGYGQLGHDTAPDGYSAVPVQVMVSTNPVEYLTGVVSIAAGGDHAFALKSDGTILAWGGNSYGQFGTGKAPESLVPVQVDGVTDVASIAAGGLHTASLKSDETVWAWGWNTYGQLGDGKSYFYRYTPEEAPGISNAVAISAGYYHTAALRRDESAWTWGGNYYGQLGDGTTTTRKSPVELTGITNAVGIAGGTIHTVAVISNGTVMAWGGNYHGQLGDGSTDNRSTPLELTGIGGVDKVASGASHTVALDSNGNVWTWGRNHNGQLGDGTTDNRYTPAQVGISNVVDIAAGYSHTVALDSDGNVWAWGYNGVGSVGDGTTANRLAPVKVKVLTDPVEYLTGVVSIAAGGYHTLAVKDDGTTSTVWAWGWNGYGQLGDGTIDNRLAPVQVKVSTDPVEYLTGVVSIAGGHKHSVALKSDGTVRTWGNNSFGQLGVRPYYLAPVATGFGQ